MIKMDRHQNGDSESALSNNAVKIETEEEEEYEEIIDDEFEEDEADEVNKGPATANKKQENAGYGLGSFEQPLVKFYFTAPCPQLGLDEVYSFDVIANL